MEIITYHRGILKGLTRAMDLSGEVVLLGDWFSVTLDEENKNRSFQLRVKGIVHIIQQVYRYIKQKVLVSLSL